MNVIGAVIERPGSMPRRRPPTNPATATRMRNPVPPTGSRLRPAPAAGTIERRASCRKSTSPSPARPTGWPAGTGKSPISRRSPVPLDSKIQEMRQAFGEIGDMRLHVMAALMVADEASELQRRVARLERSWPRCRADAVPPTNASARWRSGRPRRWSARPSGSRRSRAACCRARKGDRRQRCMVSLRTPHGTGALPASPLHWRSWAAWCVRETVFPGPYDSLGSCP